MRDAVGTAFRAASASSRRPSASSAIRRSWKSDGVGGLADDALHLAPRPQGVDDARPDVRVQAPGLAVRRLGGLEQPAVAARVHQAGEDLGIVAGRAGAGPAVAPSPRASAPSPTRGGRRACGRRTAPGRARARAGSRPRPARGSPRGARGSTWTSAGGSGRAWPTPARRPGRGPRTGGTGRARRPPGPSRAPPRWRAGRTRRRGRSPGRPGAWPPSRPASEGESASTIRCVSSSCSRNTSPIEDWSVCVETSVPAGASTSCVVTRSCSPARSRLPSSAWPTSACVARALRSGVSPAKRATAALERTTIEGSPASEFATASASANDRKSISGSGRSSRNGSTASRVSGRATARPAELSESGIASSSARARPPRRAARRGAWRARGGSAGRARPPRRRPASAGGSSWSVADSTSTALVPRKAGRPAIASYRIAPAAKRSVRASVSCPSTCSGAM